MTRLILIRHGETDYNLQNIYCGFANPPLNNKGIWQSKRLAARLKALNLNKVYTSDLKRAYETAKIVFENKSIEKVADLREINFGIFEGLKYEKINKNYPELHRNWIDDPKKAKIPYGEGLRDLTRRVKQSISSILSQHRGKTLAVVTHSGPIKILLCQALRVDLEMFWQIGQESAALNIIDYVKGPLSLRRKNFLREAVVVKMNDTSHLSMQEGNV